MELLRGLGITDISFLVPIIVVVVLLIIIAKVAKKMFKFAALIAVIALAVIIYLNLPNLTVENGTATLKLYGVEHRISSKDAKVVIEDRDGDKQTVLVSGTEHIDLPFSKSFAEKFIIEKLKEEK